MRGRVAASWFGRAAAPAVLPVLLLWSGASGHAGEPEPAADAPTIPASDSRQPDAAALIERMSEAMRTLDYEGTFVHSARGHLSSLRILHSTDERGELERLTALDGEPREVIRDHARVTCIWPASEVVSVAEAKLRSGLPDVDAALADNPAYTLNRGAPGRVAGLPADTVHIEPVDALRYGYRFWIDSTTHMLLRSMLVDGTGRVLEEVLFTRIDYPESIDAARFAIPDGARAVAASLAASSGGASPTPSRATAELVADGAGELVAGGDASGGTSKATAVADRVGFETLPAGYAKLDERFSAMPIEGGPVSHVMVSDGVASVSVYVEHVPRSRQDLSLAGLSSIGAVSAYGRSLPEGFVTVVGEVPPATVRLVADAVTLR